MSEAKDILAKRETAERAELSSRPPLNGEKTHTFIVPYSERLKRKYARRKARSKKCPHMPDPRHEKERQIRVEREREAMFRECSQSPRRKREGRANSLDDLGYYVNFRNTTLAEFKG